MRKDKKARKAYPTDLTQTHQMLKAAFPVDVNADRATYEIQYGSITRPTHKNTDWDAMKFETCAHKVADLSEGNFGVSLLNDCKYGHDIHNGEMLLSLLRSPAYPNPDTDQGHMSCVYALVPHAGALDLPGISAMAYALNNPMQVLPAMGEKNILPEMFFVVHADHANIVCEVVKEAEDGDDLILRLYENSNSKTVNRITEALHSLYQGSCRYMRSPYKNNPLSVVSKTFYFFDCLL